MGVPMCRVVALLLLAALPGCSLLDSYQTEASRYRDDYDFVGEEGRGDRPREKESDGLSKWIESPQARSINRNLGIE